jgi:hypothetical protein
MSVVLVNNELKTSNSEKVMHADMADLFLCMLTLCTAKDTITAWLYEYINYGTLEQIIAFP